MKQNCQRKVKIKAFDTKLIVLEMKGKCPNRDKDKVQATTPFYQVNIPPIIKFLPKIANMVKKNKMLKRNFNSCSS